MTWKVQLPLGERKGLEHKGTGSPGSSQQDSGGQRTQDPQEAQDPDVPVLFLLYFLKPQEVCFGEGLLPMAARRADPHSGGDSTSDRTDPLRSGRGALSLPPQHEAGPSEGRARRRFCRADGERAPAALHAPSAPKPTPNQKRGQ